MGRCSDSMAGLLQDYLSPKPTGRGCTDAGGMPLSQPCRRPFPDSTAPGDPWPSRGVRRGLELGAVSINSPCPRGLCCKEEVRGPTWGLQLRQRKHTVVIPNDECFFQTVLFVSQITSTSSKETQSAAHDVSLAGCRAGTLWGGDTMGQGCGWKWEGMVTRTPSSPKELWCLLLFQIHGYVGLLPDAKTSAQG